MRTVFLILSIVLLVSCDTLRVSEGNKDFPDRIWFMDSVASFSFTIEDTTKSYRLILNLRNAVNYPYQNLYIGYTLEDSLDQVLATNIDDLRDLDNFQLFDPKSGEPYGKGLGDIFEHRFSLIDTLNFQTQGMKTLNLQQFMRETELEGIVSVGYRLEFIREE
jgi:gliding motility-associated lipoprotein GldH